MAKTTPSPTEQVEQLVRQIRSNSNFRKAFMDDPRKVLEERGFKIPSSVKHIKVCQDLPDTAHLVIPYKRRTRSSSNKLWELMLSRRPTVG